MIRTMLSGLAVTATLSMALSGHAVSGDVDGRDFLIWQRGGSPSKAKSLAREAAGIAGKTLYSGWSSSGRVPALARK